MGQADSKLAFRKGFFRLFEEKSIAPAEDAFWSQFWTLPETAEDIFSLVGASEIRKIRDSASDNLFTLVDKLVSTLTVLVWSRDFPSANHPTLQLLNCVRVLTRIMPFIFESEDATGAIKRFFWDPMPLGLYGTSTAADKADQSGSESSDLDRSNRLATRAGHMLQIVVDALFIPSLTLPAGTGRQDGTRPYTVWEAGIGSSKEIGTTSEMISNRAEMLRFLLVLLSKALYMNVASVIAGDNPWAELITVHAPKAQVLPLLCSLLNTAMRYDPGGWGLPYDHMLMTDHRETVVALSLQTLNALLDYRPPGGDRLMQGGGLGSRGASSSRVSLDSTSSEHASFAEPAGGRTPSPQGAVSERKLSGTLEQPNLFRSYLSKIFKERDFAFLFEGMHRILSNPMKASNTLLPGSTRCVKAHQETFMLFWTLAGLNKKFATVLMESDQVLDMMILLLYFQMENKANYALLGLVRMCALILHWLSGDRRFAIQLNKTYDGNATLPRSLRLPAFSGSYADFLIITVHAIISTTQHRLAELYSAYLLALSNISPYLKNLSVVSSNKLVQLFALFSNPRFLLAAEENHLLLRYILEPFDYIIQYQFSANPHLVYAMLRSHKRFEALASFSLERSLESIRRAEAKASGAGQQVQQNSPTPSSGTKEQELRLGADSRRGSLASMNSHARPTDSEGRPEDDSTDGAELARDLSAIPAVDKGKGRLREDGEQNVQLPAGDSPANHENGARQTSPTMPRKGSRFIPTEAWVSSWQSNLPLRSIMTVIRALRPRIEQFCMTNNLTTQEEVVQFLKNESIVGLVPAPPPVSPRKFAWSDPVRAWFASYLWGVIFVGNQFPIGMWNGTRIVLFTVKTQKTKP